MLRRADPYAVAICAAYPIPDHIAAIASAVRYDLLNGPSWLLLPGGDVSRVNFDCVASFRSDLADEAESGDVIEQTYVGRAAAALRAFIDDLPGDVWVDGDCVSEREPDAFWDTGEVDEDGEPIIEECDFSDCWHVDGRDVVRALFGRTIAGEFR